MGNTPRLCLALMSLLALLACPSANAGFLRNVLLQWQSEGAAELRKLGKDDLNAVPQDHIIEAAQALKEIKGSRTLLNRLKSLFDLAPAYAPDSLQAFLNTRKLSAKKISSYLQNNLDPTISLEENVSLWITAMDTKFKEGNPVEPEELLALHASLSEYSFKQVESLLQSNPDVYGYAAGVTPKLLRLYDKTILRISKVIQRVTGAKHSAIDLGQISLGFNLEVLSAPDRCGAQEVIAAMLEAIPIQRLSAEATLKRFYNGIVQEAFVKKMADTLCPFLKSA
ncbi:hypothetical protein WDW86_06920 [Bdellovibrionota bacterium FG-2]